MSNRQTDETRLVERMLHEKFPTARVDVYRHNSASIRVRMIDERFRGRDRVEREDEVLPILRALPEATLSDVTVLLLLTEAECSSSVMNLEFEDPVPSSL